MTLILINININNYLAFVVTNWYLNIIGKPTAFYLHENTRVSGEFKGCDVECSKIFVNNLETPMGTIPGAILRSSDLIYLDVDNINVD